jgi:hypothetical protein
VGTRYAAYICLDKPPLSKTSSSLFHRLRGCFCSARSSLERRRMIGETLLSQFRKSRFDPRKNRGLSELQKYTLCFGQMLKRGLPPALSPLQ